MVKRLEPKLISLCLFAEIITPKEEKVSWNMDEDSITKYLKEFDSLGTMDYITNITNKDKSDKKDQAGIQEFVSFHNKAKTKIIKI